MKKLLILGGKPIGSCELAEHAKKRGIYTIVTDYLEDSPAKLIADERWEISTADLDKLEAKARECKVDGVLTGVHGFNIRKMAELTERLGLPCYCTVEQRIKIANKKYFKKLCEKHQIRISREYKLNPLTDDISGIEYPVIVKPADNGGSRGFSKCSNAEELKDGYRIAAELSDTSDVLIEEFIPYDAAIIHYTARDGEISFGGISDKISKKLGENGGLVMALQHFPSEHIPRYLEEVDKKAVAMLKEMGIKEGPIWIEAFNNNGEFIFNEMGFRFGGSMTNYPVRYYYGRDQLREMVDYALGIKEVYDTTVDTAEYPYYCILPVHSKAGVINSVQGEDEVKNMPEVEAVTRVHYKGDNIQDWGTANQVFCYLHIKYRSKEGLKNSIAKIKDTLKVYDSDGKQMLFYLIKDEEI